MTRISLFALVFLGLAGLSACTKGVADPKANDAPPTVVEPVPDPNLIKVDKPGRFETVPVASRAEVDQLQVNGVIAPDVNRTVPVNTLTSGRVVSLKVRLGDDVKQGQVLMTMTSPDLTQAISNYRKFQSAEALAKTQLERAQTLLQHGAIPQKDVEVAEDAYRQVQVDRASTAEQIKILGGDLNTLSSTIEVKSPATGTIVDQQVTPAAGVKSLDNSPNLFTIADLSKVWVLCDVWENNLAQVHVGDRAEIELAAYPNRRFLGRVENISKVLDPNTRTAKVRIELPNDQGIMRPNMFAVAHFLSQGSHARAVVPVSAVLRLQDRYWVFVKTGEDQFKRTEVQAGPVNADGTQQVLAGLKPGDQVVKDALQFDREATNKE
jgi:cobalt-zinc-cadmium efflux system membrane fusion protein